MPDPSGLPSKAGSGVAPPGGPPVAGLPMYDWPELRWATDALWQAIATRLRDAGIPAPAALDRGRTAAALWADPALVLGQTCGWPYVSSLRGRVRLVATPCYRAEGCDGPTYRSLILVRRDEPAAGLRAMTGRTAAVNDRASLSGWVALAAAMRRHAGGVPLRTVPSGSHRASMRMVADGAADLCAADAVCWALALRHDLEVTDRLRVLAATPPLPALPFICAAGLPWPADAIRAALDAALADPGIAEARDALLLAGTVALPDEAYDRVADLAAAA
jgi:ABC-type phosphate/phosphonate transport system substrate-binding protein